MKIFAAIIISATFAIFASSCGDNSRPTGPDNGSQNDSDTTGNGNGNGNGGDPTDPPHVPTYIGNPPVVINEIAAFNSTLADEFGDHPGWIELYNPADSIVNLLGYYLTDRADRKRWVFGNVPIEGRAYQVVFMSGKNKASFEEAGSGVNILSRGIGAWSWADSQNDPPGGSTATFNHTHNTNIGGSIVAADNTATLGWTSAEICLKFNNWEPENPNNQPPTLAQQIAASTDLSQFGQIVFRGYLTQGRQLDIRFAQAGAESWLSCGTTITGTGITNDEYVVNLMSLDCRQSAAANDLSQIRWIRFANAPTFRGTLEFNFTSITAFGGGNLHATFELNRNSGGAIFLMDAQDDIRDSTAYPAIERGFSLALNSSNRWVHARPPTPGAANDGEMHDVILPPPQNATIPQSGHHATPLSFTIPAGSSGATIRCDTTGRAPSSTSPLTSGTNIVINANGGASRAVVLRCAQFSQTAHHSAPIMRTYIVGRLPNLPIVSIAVDPHDMFDRTVGLYERGPNAQMMEPFYGSNFWADTELPIHIDFFERSATHQWSHPAGIRIFGNWSRGAAKKSLLITFRSEYGGPNRLDYPLFPEHSHLTRFKHFLLRNNGNNAGLDYIRDMLMTSLTEGLDIEHQRGRSAVVYFNGQYWGIHNIRERSNADFFETNIGVRQDFIDLVKSDGEVSEGSDADYQRVVSWLEGLPPNSLSDADLQQLRAWLDIDNYTNYIQAQVFYVNKDWPGNNLKRWRVNSPPTRWRWFMYDTDHGFGSFGMGNSPHVPMLNFITSPVSSDRPDWPNPPHSTFLTRKLFQNESYRRGFINRFSLLLSTYFTSDRIANRIDALMAPIRDEIPYDEARWVNDHQNLGGWRWGSMARNEYQSSMENFGRTRPNQMRTEIEQFFSSTYGLNMSASANLTLSAIGNGKIFVHDLEVPFAMFGNSITFRAYQSVPITLRAEPNQGMTFVSWSDGVTTATRTVTVNQAMTLTANFL